MILIDVDDEEAQGQSPREETYLLSAKDQEIARERSLLHAQRLEVDVGLNIIASII